MTGIDLDWIARNVAMIAGLFWDHLLLSYIPCLAGLLIAVPLGMACVRWQRLYLPTLVLSTVVFAIPSLALFVLMLPFTGLTAMTAIVPLTLYAVAMLVRNVVDGMRNVDAAVQQSATAMGYSRLHRILAVEFPVALPVVIAGLRVTTVAAIGAVAVTSVLGLPSLGTLFVDGTQRFFLTPIVVGIVLTAAFAAVTDLLLVWVQRTLTPWSRRRAA